MFEQPIKVIAEIGQNHNGDLDEAKKLIDMAARENCYAVKSAKRDIASFPKEWKEKLYDNSNSYGATYYDHRLWLELSKDHYSEMQKYAYSKGLKFGSSFTDIPSLKFLCEQKVDFLKIASSRVADTDLLYEVAKANLPVIISTGMSDEGLIDQAIEILKDAPYLAIMLCTSAYPTELNDLNLGLIPILKGRYGFPVGLSSHCLPEVSLIVATTAYGLGAEWFEFHITRNRMQKGTDHKFSLESLDLKLLTNYLKLGWIAVGELRKKEILACELPYMQKLRDDLK